MPKARSGDTKARIQAVALDLFAEQGMQQTSLRQIADRLGVTKPALYYHFASREELVGSLVTPLFDDFNTYVEEQEAAASADPRALLESYFDLAYKHRRLIQVALSDMTVLHRLDLASKFIDWRQRLIALLIGPDPSLDQQVRGMVALGGLSDCAVMFEHVDPTDLRGAAVAAAVDTLQA